MTLVSTQNLIAALYFIILAGCCLIMRMSNVIFICWNWCKFSDEESGERLRGRCMLQAQSHQPRAVAIWHHLQTRSIWCNKCITTPISPFVQITAQVGILQDLLKHCKLCESALCLIQQHFYFWLFVRRCQHIHCSSYRRVRFDLHTIALRVHWVSIYPEC